ncbi:MAG: hypothetical protein U0168_11200 [Nannocystaceae bacterium]
MLAPEMTLPAALRDAQHPDGAVRIAGLRNLAPALLAALDRPGPARCRDDEHPDVPAVRERLLAALADPVPDARGYAAMGLGTLGQLVVIDAVAPWLTLADDDADGTWLRETAVIALSYVGVALGDADAGARARVLSLLREAWNAPWPELRFQAALARIEVDDPLAEAELAAVLADGPRDDEPAHEGQLRAQIVFALGHVARLRPSTLDVLVRALERLPTHDLLATEIAIVLAAHERREGLASLRAALVRRFDRDRALEALAALGAPDPPRPTRPCACCGRGFRRSPACARPMPCAGSLPRDRPRRGGPRGRSRCTPGTRARPSARPWRTPGPPWPGSAGPDRGRRGPCRPTAARPLTAPGPPR